MNSSGRNWVIPYEWSSSVQAYSKSRWVSSLFRGFGTLVVGTIPGKGLFLTSMEVSKSYVLKSTEDFKIPEVTHVAIANGVAGLISSLIFESYFVPLDVVRWYVLPVSLFFHSIIECILSFLFLKVVKYCPNEKNHFSYQILKVLGIEFISMMLLPPLTTSDQIWRVGINFKWWCSRHSPVIKCEGLILISNGEFILGAQWKVK